MLYVERSKEGSITALHNTSSPVVQEQKQLLDEEVLEFLNSSDSREQSIAMSDFGAVRIIEDLINVLIKKGSINFTDLPEHAQQKIRDREHLREKLVSQDLLVHDII